MSEAISVDPMVFRVLAIRRGLRLEVKVPGMKVTRGANVANVARETIGSTTRSKAKLYAELDAWMVERGFDSLPL